MNTGFCDKARLDQSGALSRIGRSDRYTAMVLIGLTMQERLGRKADFDTDKICERLVSWVEQGAQAGDAGLVLCVLAMRGDDRAEHIAQIIRTRENRIADQRVARNSMSLGYLLTGLSVAIRKGCGQKDLIGIADHIFDLIVANRNPGTGLFSLTGHGFRETF